jgi:site-specific DNA recombinase
VNGAIWYDCAGVLIVALPAPARRRAIGYPRVSDDKQASEDKTSLQTQADEIRAYCDQHGYELVGIYPEVHTGQELWEREVLTKIREMLRRGVADVLVPYTIDRFARDPDHQAILFSEAAHYGYEIEFVDGGPPDNTPEGGLLRYIKAYAAKREVLAFVERQMRGRRARAQSGKLQGQGARLYGYTYHPETGTRTILESEAEVVRMIYGWAEEGLAERGIMSRLWKLGIPSPSVGHRTFKDGRTPTWGTGGVHGILTNPAYKGETYQFRWKAGKKSKQIPVSLRPEDEWIRLPDGVTPPIIAPDRWDRILAIHQANRGSKTRNRKHPSLLRGLLRCERCGTGSWVGWMRERRVYRCGSYATPSGRCGASQVPADWLENAVWSAIAARFKDRQWIADEIRALHERESGETQLAMNMGALERRISEITTRQQRLIVRFGEGDDSFPWELVESEVKRLQAERQRLEGDLASMRAESVQQHAAMAWLTDLVATCEQIAGGIDELEFEDRRELLELLQTTVKHDGRTWSLRAGIPVKGVPQIEARGDQGGEKSVVPLRTATISAPAPIGPCSPYLTTWSASP